METLSYKTKSAKSSEVVRNWHVVDAEGLVLGRLCSKIATVLRGKHKPSYTPHIDCGDCVIVLNSDKVKLTGNKLDDKIYLRHTGYPGGQRAINAKRLVEKKPIALIETSVRGMLPKNRLGRAMFKKLFVYAGGEHPHEAQKPQPFKL